MAALGKIRSKGVTLVIIIALGLFAFIAEEAFRSCNGIKGEQSQQVGEILGQKINVQEFQALIQEAEDFQKAMSGSESLDEQQQTQIREQVWQQYVSQKIIENEAEKLGLTVTDDEVMNVLKQGTGNVISRSIPQQLYNQQTGRFDYTVIQQFLSEYNKAKAANQVNENMETMHTMWLYCEKQLRNNLLQEKYTNLIQGCVLSNKVEAQMAFNDQNEEATIELAYLAYSSVKDADVKVTDEDLKAKYEELKPLFRHPYETRDIKFVDFTIIASDADRKALSNEMAGYQKTLAEATDPAEALTTMGSQIPYLGVPTSSNIYPADIKAKIDSAAVGTSEVFETKGDNTLNIVRLVSKESLPDSIEFRAISVAEQAKADSIKTAMAGGADFEAIAKNYGQPGTKQWFTGNDYERQASSLNPDMRKYIDAMLHGEVNAVQDLEISQTHIILQVTDRRAITDKYVVAVVKKPIEYSKATRANAYNNFSEYVAKNQTLDGLQKNATKYGYTVQSAEGLTTSGNKIGGVTGSGLKEPLKWVFQAKVGEVSPLYEATDHLLVIYLDRVDETGYLTLDNPQVKEFVKREAIKDKKAEKLMAQLKGVNSIKAAQAKGAKVETLDHVTFGQSVSIQSLQTFEPALCGAVARTAQGKFVSAPVKGFAGVYVFQVVKKQKGTAKFDETMFEQQCAQTAMESVFGNLFDTNALRYGILMFSPVSDPSLKADIVDNRYLFF